MTRAQISGEEVDTVAATIDIETESGTWTGPTRRHQGYWAGDFVRQPQVERD